MWRCIAGLAFSNFSKTNVAYIVKVQGIKEEWARLGVAGLVASSLLRERNAWICSDGQIGLAWSSGEVENPWRVVWRKRKKKKKNFLILLASLNPKRWRPLAFFQTSWKAKPATQRLKPENLNSWAAVFFLWGNNLILCTIWINSVVPDVKYFWGRIYRPNFIIYLYIFA